jgi:5-oxoprolinase (ATP-hydrolysing)
MQKDGRWSYWVDVGGTFTDGVAVDPQGSIHTGKMLSSGKVLGSIQSIRPGQITDPARHGEPENLWLGSQIELFDSNRNKLGRWRILRSQGSLLEWDPLDGQSNVQVATEYTIDSRWEAPVALGRKLMGLSSDAPLPAMEIRLGTTRGTNALLTRSGADVTLVTTEGFGDLLEIGEQDRPELFQLKIEKRKPLYRNVVEVAERIAVDGTILKPLDIEEAATKLQEVFDSGVRSLAICLLHGFRHPQHEVALGSLAQRIGFQQVSISHQVAPRIKAVLRAETTVLDAYLSPVVRDYLRRLADQFGCGNQRRDSRSRLLIMNSRGGLVPWQTYRGIDSVLSGPSGGVTAIGGLVRWAELGIAIGLDMGGTSTDVCCTGSQPRIQQESTKAGVRMLHPVLEVETVAAGGGSICWFDGVALRVGPSSAGSNPGPACYGRGGPLTITDLNLWMGRVDAPSFPFPLDREMAGHRLRGIEQQIAASRPAEETDDLDGRLCSLDRLASHFRMLANQQMAEAIRATTIQAGIDPRSMSLIGFGGAAGQHLCEIADILNIPRIIDSPHAGMLSAVGMGMATLQHAHQSPVHSPFDADAGDWVQNRINQAIGSSIVEWRKTFGLGDATIPATTSVELELRYRGSDNSLLIPWNASVEEARNAFGKRHQEIFGYARPNHPVEWTAIHTTSSDAQPSSEPLPPTDAGQCPPRAPRTTRLFSQQKWQDAWVMERSAWMPNRPLDGPGLILSSGHTTVVDAGWTARCDSAGILYLHRITDARETTSDSATGTSQVDLLPEVVAFRLGAIAEQMGRVLQQTAMSVNVKERKDFSCAIFTADGQLAANAPHVPVHLGAMSDTVREMVAKFPAMHPGESFLTNDPYCGGSHLPDITVVSPVHDSKGILRFFVANRAHHAEIGGMSPGSMPPGSRCLEDEGVILPPQPMMEQGALHPAIIRQLEQAKYPSRNPNENIADLLAQHAANQRGIRQLQDWMEPFSWNRIEESLEATRRAVQKKTNLWIDTLPDRTMQWTDSLDDGTAICVTIRKQPDGILELDFQGTSGVHPSHYNANPSIVHAAAQFVIRASIADQLPLNSGLSRCLRLILPTGLLNPPQKYPIQRSPAVAAGNVETSQRVVDVILGALGDHAASQGTMNNFLFGNERFGYYETIGGGVGAAKGYQGASAVHSHMTNTRLTDPEVLEARYPIRMLRFAIRRGSGGRGRWPGGDGMIREFLFLEPLTVTMIGNRYGHCPPYGAEGGEPGQVGEIWLVRRNGESSLLPGRCQIEVQAGDSWKICTPGGGGFGSPQSDSAM